MQENKHIFNFYIEDIDDTFISEVCKSGEVVSYKKGDCFCRIGQYANFVGFIKNGSFKYIVNTPLGKAKVVGFALENTFVADYPKCFFYQPAVVSIEALTEADVYVIPAEVLYTTLKSNNLIESLANAMFNYVYVNFLDCYSLSPKERYLKFLKTFPHIINDVSLHDLASYLQITPTYLSKIRKKITFEE